MQTRRAFVASLAALPLAGSLARPAFAATPPVYAEGGIAIDGTDPVAYFAEGAPVPGLPEFALDWMGATWRFSTEENRARFEADPEAHAPQFGGYCAWAVSQGYTAPTVPEAWTIHDGKLYLNANLRIRRRFERDVAGFVAAAEANWPGVLG